MPRGRVTRATTTCCRWRGSRYEEAPGRFLTAAQHEVQVLDSLSLAVHAGEVVAVVGASGAGKSLLADCLLGLFDPHATVTGRIWFDGME